MKFRFSQAPTLGQAFARADNNFNLLRLIAAMLVIYGHAYPITGSTEPDLLLRVVKIRYAGSIAVDMFFLISGLLIAASLERNRLPVYLGARVLRIYPALIACLAMTVLVLGPWLTTSDTYWSHETWQYFRKNLLIGRTEYMLPGVFTSLPINAVNGSLWTLQIEFHLYLLLAVLSVLRLFTRQRFTWAAMFLFAALCYRYRLDPRESRLEELWCIAFFLAGSVAWFHRDRIVIHPAGVIACIVIAAFARDGMFARAAYFVALFYTTLFLAFVPRLPRIRHADFSYGLYLYGWPVQQCVQLFFPGNPWWNTGTSVLIALGLACASWYLVESPALALKRRIGTRVARGDAVSAAAG